MKNFDLTKYLAEGKLYEAINLDIEDDIAYLDGDSGTYEAEIEDGKASFSVIYDDLDYRISDQYNENNIEVSVGLFAQVKTKMKERGRFILVANKHLNYWTHLEKIFPNTEVMAIDDKFEVYDCRN